jgi:hypothetical protein
VIYYLQRQRKELAFGVLAEHHLLGVDEELADRVIVTFDGQPVKNIKLVIFGVKNSGNQPIRANDFEDRSMRFTFGENSKVLSTEIIRQSPQNLGCSLEVLDDTAHIKPLLLNSNDYFVVQALVTVPEVNMQADSRIVGVSRLSALSVQKPSYKVVILSLFILPIFALYSMMVLKEVTDNHPTVTDYLAMGAPFLLIILLLSDAIPRWKNLLANPIRRYIDRTEFSLKSRNLFRRFSGINALHRLLGRQRIVGLDRRLYPLGCCRIIGINWRENDLRRAARRH